MINEHQIPREIWRTSFQLTKDIDENDTVFVALTEFINGKLWTLDKELKDGLINKSYDKIIDIPELKSRSLTSE